LLPEWFSAFLRNFASSRTDGRKLKPRAGVAHRVIDPLAVSDEEHLRRSSGLEQFFTHIGERTGLNILDLSGASQANVAFITNLGHKLYSNDFVRNLELNFGDSLYDGQVNPRHMEYFLLQNLNYEEQQFDGILVWDVLEYLAAPMLPPAIDQLFRMVKPGSYLFAVFHSQERAESVLSYSFRIQDARSLLLTPRGMRRPAQLFSNRAIEKVFQRYEYVKFFLTRENLREVIVKR